METARAWGAYAQVLCQTKIFHKSTINNAVGTLRSIYPLPIWQDLSFFSLKMSICLTELAVEKRLLSTSRGRVSHATQIAPRHQVNYPRPVLPDGRAEEIDNSLCSVIIRAYGYFPVSIRPTR